MQMCDIVLCCYPVGLQNSGNLYALVLCTLGAILGILTLCYNKIGNFSVYPEIKNQTILITDVPYQYIRHPMYTSLIVMMCGVALYNYHWLNAVGVILVVVAVINKANIEEKLLLMRFAEYANYKFKTHRFLPYIY